MKKIAFSGASGNGISPLEQIMLHLGYQVYGSDKSFDLGKDSARLRALKSVGLKIVPQDGSMITPDIEYLCVSAAINQDNPDVLAARQLGIPIKFRSDLLLEILSSYRYGVAVGGTAGKTTVTAMIGYILDVLGKKPCMINGGALCNYAERPGIPNYIYNDGEICVIEADESDGSIQKYHPYVGLITNISHDHTSLEKLFSYFSTFAEHSQNLVISLDFPNHAKITHPHLTTFSLNNPQADFFADEIVLNSDSISYRLQGKNFTLPLIGKFNVANALAAIAVCSKLGIPAHDSAKVLEGFYGVKTRLEKVGTTNGITVYNDFAHNPSKIEASLLALKSGGGRIIAMYQPHTSFSARNTGEETAAVIARTLAPDDIMLMQEIYEIAPQDTAVSSQNIINLIRQNGHSNAFYSKSYTDTLDYIKKHATSGDKIIIMGAHDNSLFDLSCLILKELQSETE